MNLEEVREKARQKLMGICGLYKDCDGAPMRICQGQSYGKPLKFGGIGSGTSFHNNFLAFRKHNIKMKVLGDHFEPDTSYDFLGKKLTIPIMAASVSGVNSFGGEEIITEKEFCRSVVLGCKAAGTIGWRGDTYTYSLDSTPGFNAIEEANGWGVKIVKPRDQETIIKLFQRAEKIGCIAVGTDVDGCESFAMYANKKPVFRKNVDELRELASSTKLPFIVKGIMSIEDAEKAYEAGATTLVVSNHGGRVLDHTPGSLDVLPEIVAAFKSKIKILLDGGVRTGYDVFKALALGAEAVLIGRDIVRAAVGAGIEGVKVHMEYMQATLSKAMKLTGCKTLSEITSELLYKAK